MTLTKIALRTALKALAAEIDLQVKYQSSATVTVPVPLLERWTRRVLELSEDEILWT